MFDKRKTEAENMHENIVEIKKATIFVKNYVQKQGFIIYGGTAIHLALLAAGHEGLYEKNKLADYDFFCAHPIAESEKLMSALKNEGFEANAINALHLTTRRVRIGKTAVADLSYFPFIEKLPTLTHNGFKFVHPLFQTIDMHISLTYLYRNDYWKHRMQKDIKRLNLITETYPFSFLLPFLPKAKKNQQERRVPAATAIEKGSKGSKGSKQKKNILDLFTTDTVHEKLEKTLHQNLMKIVNTYLGKNICFAGDVALALTEKLVCENNSALKPLLRETEINTIEVFEDKNPSQSDERKGAKGKGSRSDLSSLRSKDENYEQLLDIFPQAIVKKGAIYFQNYGDLLAANKTKYGWIVNTHYLAATYLFKFFMIGHHSFLDKYFNCTLLLKYGTNPKLPNTINGEYFGSANINLPWLFDAKRESCALLKIDYLDRPSFSRPGAKKGEEHYETFKVRGMQTNKLLNKTIECK